MKGENEFMQMNLKIGDRWGCVSVIAEEHEENDKWEGNKQTTFYRLKCDCGEEMLIDKTDWQGKRRTMDCGCGCADDRENDLVFLSGTMPRWLRRKLDDYAKELQWSRNRANIEILRAFLGEREKEKES